MKLTFYSINIFSIIIFSLLFQIFCNLNETPKEISENLALTPTPENSIKFKPSGSHILGYSFWKYGLSHSRKYKQRLDNIDINQMIINNT